MSERVFRTVRRDAGTPLDAAVKNHANGAKNQSAHLGFECPLEDTVDAPPVTGLLNLYHYCPASDGKSAVLVASGDVVEEYTDERVWIAGVGAVFERVGLFQRDSYTTVESSRLAGEQAYEAAGISPEDLDLAEGVTDLNCALPVNPSGTEVTGPPFGATGGV